MNDCPGWKGTNDCKEITSERCAGAVAQIVRDVHQLPGRILHHHLAPAACFSRAVASQPDGFSHFVLTITHFISTITTTLIKALDSLSVSEPLPHDVS